MPVRNEDRVVRVVWGLLATLAIVYALIGNPLRASKRPSSVVLASWEDYRENAGGQIMSGLHHHRRRVRHADDDASMHAQRTQERVATIGAVSHRMATMAMSMQPFDAARMHEPSATSAPNSLESTDTRDPAAATALSRRSRRSSESDEAPARQDHSSLALIGDCCPRSNGSAVDDPLLPRPGDPGDARLCPFMLPSDVLLFRPSPVRGQKPTCLDLDIWPRRDGSTAVHTQAPLASSQSRPIIEFSVIVNVFNHEGTIGRVLRQVLKLTNES